MLPKNVQLALANRYGGARVKKAFDQTIVEGFAAEFADEAVTHSAAIFIDVAGFSKKTDGLGPAQVRAFLDAYYEATLPRIFARGGMIDRIAGDGIIAIFSGFFRPELVGELGEDAALGVAEDVVRGLRGTDHAAKAAVATGKLLYCKTGVASVYEEFTVIGAPLTELYRIEEIAKVDQVVLRADRALGRRVWLDILTQTSTRGAVPAGHRTPVTWSADQVAVPLRGVSGGAPVPLLVQTCVR